MTAPIVFFGLAAALSILSSDGPRERAQLRSLVGDSCTKATAVADSSPITFRAAVPPRVSVGQPIPITLTLANHSNRGVQMSVNEQLAGLKGFDIEITRVSDGAHVWNRSGGITVWIDVGHFVDTLAPGDSVVYADRWTQKMNNREFAAPGAYCIRGLIDVQPLDGHRHKRLFTTDAASVTIVAGDN
jgi:hypothetical protein